MNSWNYNNNNMYQYPSMGNVWNRPGMQQLPRYEAPLIHGQPEANGFPMAANSEIYLPDADKDLIWWIKTDQMGNRQVIPFDVALHKDPEPVDLNNIVERLNALEEKFYAKQNKSNAKRTNTTVPTTDTSATTTE